MNRFARAWRELRGLPADDGALARVCEKAALDKQLADDIIESQEKRYTELNVRSIELANSLFASQKANLELEAQIRRITGIADQAIAQRDSALSALQDAGVRVDKLVDHLMDLKREGFSVPSPQSQFAPDATVFPASIERALTMRNFDDRIDRMNRQYALDQLRERPDDADQIALEIIRGELQDAPEGTEPTEEAIAAD